MGTRALYAFSDLDLELDNAAFFYSNGGSSGATCRNNFDGGAGYGFNAETGQTTMPSSRL